MQESSIAEYFSTLSSAIESTNCTSLSGQSLSRADAFDQAIQLVRSMVENSGKVLFCGNGGSAGICSHMATDFFKNGQIPAIALNDSSALTCLGNDFGFEFIFSKQIEMLAIPNDVVIAISSSGQSKNIINGVDAGRRCGCKVITFSGFSEKNSLRQLGDINFHVPGKDYGFVEVAHSSLIHAILDIHMGWPDIKYPDGSA